jgi:predicted DNA-binding transcriptional regulator AlpA
MPQLHEQLLESDRLLAAKDAADRLRLSTSWLAKARMRGDGPPFVKLGRLVRYRESALAKWIRTRTRYSTSER